MEQRRRSWLPSFFWEIFTGKGVCGSHGPFCKHLGFSFGALDAQLRRVTVNGSWTRNNSTTVIMAIVCYNDKRPGAMGYCV
jgi:hypothetical protein